MIALTNFRRILFRLSICSLVLPTPAVAQEPAQALKIETAIERALENYPSIRAAQAEASAAGTGVGLARNAYLPRIEMDWQQTRGTRNNVFGQFFPQSGIPPISGPVLPTSSFSESAWGSGGGVLVSWEPFDFGLRKATVDAAKSASDEAEARIAVTRLEVASAAADAFLRVVGADQAVRAAQANVDRMESFSKSVHTLVDSELRPGADASRTDAELAAARSVLIQAKQNAAVARVALGEAIGEAGQQIIIEPEPLLELPPAPTSVTNVELSAHPLAFVQKASLDTIHARQRVLDKSFFPRFTWQTAVFGRGSGALVDGRIDGNSGLFPDTPNWATGLTITFAPTDIFNLRKRRKQESEYLAVEQARYDLTLQKLKAKEASARIFTESAEALSENTRRQLQAAQETELRVRKRYEAELATVTDVAEAQRLLAVAEVESAVARLSVWRGLLGEANARGDLKPFLELLRSARK